MEKGTYNIKVTGNGTQAQLVRDLRDLADAIEQANGSAELDGAEWETATICTDINEG